jgi:site-specific DNA recombinase
MHPHHNAQHASRKRLAIVARVSTSDQERYGTSLEDQARKGELLAQLDGMEVVDSRAYQGDESGALPLEARPIMQQVIAGARTRRFDAVCFHKIDRIARRLKYILDIWDQLDDAGVTVYIIEPAIDTSDMMGRLLRNVLARLRSCAGGRARASALT